MSSAGKTITVADALAASVEASVLRTLENWSTACRTPLARLAELLEHTGGGRPEDCPLGAGLLQLVDQHTRATAESLGFTAEANPLQEWARATGFGAAVRPSLATLARRVMRESQQLREASSFEGFS